MREQIEKIARRAGAELNSRFRSTLDMSYKSDGSIVTEADMASDRIIRTMLQEQFPHDLYYSEETSKGSLADIYEEGRGVWIVDPLDGTSNYANGLKYYCLSIGYAKFLSQGALDFQAGVVYAPAFDEIYSAQKGMGSYKNGVKLPFLSASKNQRPFLNQFLVTGFYYAEGAALKQNIELFEKVAHCCKTIRRMGAAALDMALTAEGVFDAFWEQGLKPWDVAAGCLLVSEVGGKICNYNGSEYSVYGDGLIAGQFVTVDSIQKLI